MQRTDSSSSRKVSCRNKHNHLTGLILLSALACAAFPSPSRAGSALGQLSLASGGREVPAAAIPAPLPDRFPTATHSIFGTALDSSYKADSKYGDYYPFAGETPGPTDQNNQPTTVSGLLGGMGDESGHPSLFANGGNPRSYWESALKKYNNLEFSDAYHDIGIICHLTQDQAVPVHVANINHVKTFGDRFESAAGKNISMLAKLTGNIEELFLSKMKPYEYYQALQDDTRRHLARWTDPRTGIPYWPPAAGAPPMGQDTTYGPWSYYPYGKDAYDKNVSPEIMGRQMLMAAVYTKEVLKTAADLLPPVAGRFHASKKTSEKNSPVEVGFTIYDNRRGDIKITIERPLYGKIEQAVAETVVSDSAIPSTGFSMTFSTPSPIKGKDIMIVTLEDMDGNISRVLAEASYTPPVSYSDNGR